MNIKEIRFSRSRRTWYETSWLYAQNGIQMTRKPFIFNFVALLILAICLYRWPSFTESMKDLATGGLVAAAVAWFSRWEIVPPFED